MTDRTVISLLPWSLFNYAVHIHGEGEFHYHTSFVVTAVPWSNSLEISLLHGRAPSEDWWKENASIRFPRARKAVFNRLKPNGMQTREWGLQPVPYLKLVGRVLRSIYGIYGTPPTASSGERQ